MHLSGTVCMYIQNVALVSKYPTISFMLDKENKNKKYIFLPELPLLIGIVQLKMFCNLTTLQFKRQRRAHMNR